MPRYVALLRAVNVGGRNLLPMAALRGVVEGLGHTGVTTLLQSGNVVFTATGKKATLAGQLEQALARDAGVETTVFLLTAADLRAAIAANPFTEAAESDPSRLLLHFLSATPPAGAVEAVDPKYRRNEELAVAGTVLYVWYRQGAGTSKLTAPVIERALGGSIRGTARNWNTAVKLLDLAQKAPETAS